jgi:hypothetical protein
MKKVAFILYVGCVLAFSAFARAEVAMPFSKNSAYTAPIQIESVAVDKANLELLIGGFLPNPCTQLPSAALVQDLENPAILILRLSSPVPTDVCVSRTIDFSTVVSLPVLAQNSNVVLDPNAVYIVKADGNDFEMQVQGAELMRVPGFIAY